MTELDLSIRHTVACLNIGLKRLTLLLRLCASWEHSPAPALLAAAPALKGGQYWAIQDQDLKKETTPRILRLKFPYLVID